jgi:molybdopterin-guanine dinucleotide biosynthesis adapter protein
MTALFGVTGWKNSGKTTLTTRLISELAARGYRVNSIKHAHHVFDIDQPGTDSFRHRDAGASEVAIVSGRRWALMHELRDEDEPTMREVIARLGPADIVIVEGYKREDHPKIECRRREGRKGVPLAPDDPNIVAIAADHETDSHGRTVFDLEDVSGIADFIEQHVGLRRSAPIATENTA